jgi:hypothetical protein
VTNPLGHVEEVLTHPGLGVPTIVTDVNDVESQYVYDGFGRPRLNRYADGRLWAIDYSTDRTLPLLESLWVVTTEDNTGVRSVTFHDVLGRVFRQTTASKPPGAPSSKAPCMIPWAGFGGSGGHSIRTSLRRNP